MGTDIVESVAKSTETVSNIDLSKIESLLKDILDSLNKINDGISLLNNFFYYALVLAITAFVIVIIYRTIRIFF